MNIFICCPLYRKLLLSGGFILFNFYLLTAQNDSTAFFQPSDKFNKSRVYFLGASTAVSYAGTMYLLNRYWYADYPKSRFHLFNDNGEWEQMDKVGHTFTAYFTGNIGKDLLKWAGVKNKKAIWYGGSLGSFFLTTVEILDGFSEKWGASPGDFIANTAGSALVISQGLLWQEQRILIKFSSHQVKYGQPEVKQRAEDLFGSSYPERVLKDYNGQTYWLSANPASFITGDTKFPKWLNFAVGYSAEGILGGFNNMIRDEQGVILQDFSHVPRYRQYFISPDIDLSRISVRSPVLRTVLNILNIIKFPAPALEYNSKQGFRGHWIYF